MKYFQNKKILQKGAAAGFGGGLFWKLVNPGARPVQTVINGTALTKRIKERAIWINNIAGIIIAVNITSHLLVSNFILQNMTARKWGNVVFTSHLTLVVPAVFETGYSASKYGLCSLGTVLYPRVSPPVAAVTNIYQTFAETNMIHLKSLARMKEKKLRSSVVSASIDI